MDRTEARPLRFPYANDENFTVALANVFTEWMEDPVVETDREALVAGFVTCWCWAMRAFDDIAFLMVFFAVARQVRQQPRGALRRIQNTSPDRSRQRRLIPHSARWCFVRAVRQRFKA